MSDIKNTALAAVHGAHEILGKDPKQTYVTMMTAGAISGHMISRTREQMHKTLDDVMDAAEAIMLNITETKQ